jgi:[ribosomal protein S5]-alanine N-acetyltransferase
VSDAPPGRDMMDLLETARLVLRRLTEDDAEFILQLLNEPSFLRFIGDRGVRTLDDARAYVRNGPMASYAQFGFGLLLVSRKEDGAPIGICGLLKRDTLEDADVGFAFLPPHWSKGYAVESAMAVLVHGHAAFDLRRVVAIVQPDNLGSIRVLEKLGLRFERMIRMTADGPDIMLFGRDLD